MDATSPCSKTDMAIYFVFDVSIKTFEKIVITVVKLFVACLVS